MSVKIRLTRQGAKKAPFYRIVAAESRDPRDGRFIEQLGVYDPGVEPPLFRIDEARFGHWVKNGAQPSDTVRELVQRAARNAAKTA